MEKAIIIKGLKKEYKGFKKSKPHTALNSIDLEIPRGSIFGLLGPNGAGKSTLINILAGLVTKTSGSVKVMEFDIDKNPREAKYRVGVVPQELVLDPFFSVNETLELYAGYYGITPENRRTDEIIDALGLKDKAGTNSRRLSGGMKRRVLVGKALVHNPPILILDEPTAGVDVELRRQLWRYVRELNKKGTTILLTTHYLEEAEELCDYIAIINHGNIIACDETSKLLKMFDEKQLSVKFIEKLGKIPSELEKMGAKLDDDNSISLSYKTSGSEIDKVINSIQGLGLKIKDISTSEPKLEDIFMRLTKEN